MSSRSEARRTAASRRATREGIVHGALALVLVRFEDELVPAALLGVIAGCVVAGALARGLTDYVSHRYLYPKPVPINLSERWEWVATFVQVGVVVAIAWQLGATTGIVVSAVVAGAAIPRTHAWHALIAFVRRD